MGLFNQYQFQVPSTIGDLGNVPASNPMETRFGADPTLAPPESYGQAIVAPKTGFSRFSEVMSNPDMQMALGMVGKLATELGGNSVSPWQNTVNQMLTARKIGASKSDTVPTPTPTPTTSTTPPIESLANTPTLGFQQAAPVAQSVSPIPTLGTSLVEVPSSHQLSTNSGIGTAMMAGLLNNPWSKNDNVGFNTVEQAIHRADTAQTARKLADVQAAEAGIKQRQLDQTIAQWGTEKALKEAQAGHASAQSDKIKFEMDPARVGAVEQAKKAGELSAKLDERKVFAGSAQGQLPISKAHISALPALAAYKNYGEAALAGYDLKEIDTNYMHRVNALSSAGAITDAARNQLLAQQKGSLTDRLRMTNGTIDHLLRQQTIVMDDTQKAAIKTELKSAYSDRDYLDKQLKGMDTFYERKTGASGGGAGAAKREAAKETQPKVKGLPTGATNVVIDNNSNTVTYSVNGVQYSAKLK